MRGGLRGFEPHIFSPSLLLAVLLYRELVSNLLTYLIKLVLLVHTLASWLLVTYNTDFQILLTYYSYIHL